MILTACSRADLDQDPRNSKYAPLLDAKHDDAAKQLDQALLLDPKSLDAQYYRATIEVENGDLENGIERLGKLIEKYPRYSFAYSERSRGYFKLSKWSEALADADVAIRYGPKVARNYIRRAMAYLMLSKPEKALPDLETAHQMDPKEDPVFRQVLKGIALMDLRRYQDALPILTESVDKAGKDPRPYVRRAQCYAHLKDWKQANADCNKALKLKSDDPDALFLHAALLSSANQREAARQQYLAAIKLRSDAPGVVNMADLGPDIPSVADASLACLSAKNVKLAKDILVVLQSHRPLDPEEVYVLAKAEQAKGDLFRAAKLFNECLATNPTWAQPRLDLIKLYLSDKLPQKAREIQKEGLDLPLSANDRKLVASAI